MQAIYYYPTKLSITPNKEGNQAEDDFYGPRWRHKSKRLQARRWKRLNALEKSQKETQKKRLENIRQKRWMQRHGWPRVSQPMV